MTVDHVTSYRFWGCVDLSVGPTGCWTWVGGQNASGYGILFLPGSGKRPTPAHRFSWLLHFGEIPEGMCVCHHCAMTRERLDEVAKEIELEHRTAHDRNVVTPQEEVERARRDFSQKVDRLRKSRERLHKAREALDKAIKNVEHDLINCLAAAENIEDDKGAA